MSTGRVASIEADERTMGMVMSVAERRFDFGITGSRRVRAWGLTDSFTTVVDVLAAWFDGTTLRRMGERFPSLYFSDPAQAFEDGTHVEFRWSRFVGNEEQYPKMQPLLRAAQADERLRKLFTFISMDEVLGLELHPFDESAGEIRIERLTSERYRVTVNWDDVDELHDLDGVVRRASGLAAARMGMTLP
jgi:hypothetical protein